MGNSSSLASTWPKRTVSRLLPKRRTPPSQTWRAFLDNDVRNLVSRDFFAVPTARLRVLFVLALLAHHRRRVLHFNVTEHPTAAWTAQQIVDAFPDDPLPSYLLRDRDKVYGDAFRQRPSLGVCVCQVNTDARQASRTRFWRRTRRAPTATSSGSGTSAAWTSIRCWAAFSRVPRRPRFWTPGARLRGNCAIRQAKISWWRVRDSNPRPRRCERRALPTELTPRVRGRT